MKKLTASEIREVLEYAIAKRDPEAARTAIRIGVWDKAEVYKMADLHFELMLLLAMPEPEKRGRPKDPEAEYYTWYLNMACKLKADIEGGSFSKTWTAYCERTRPKAVDYELWRCAGILEHLSGKGWRRAIAAVSRFELSKADLEAYKVVKK